MFGGVCWYCHWGWPKVIREIYERASKEIDEVLMASEENNWTSPDKPRSGYDALHFGPSHVTWEDENFDGDHKYELEFCNDPLFFLWHQPALEIVRRSLQELVALPEDIRNPPKDYHDQNPENYPPPPEWEVDYETRSN